MDPIFPQPQQNIHLRITIPQLLSFIYGDDTYTNQRAWLIRHTQSIGHCRVISRAFAEDVYNLDQEELFTHVEVYETGESSPETPPHIYTLWSRQEWLESNERVRLAKYASRIRMRQHSAYEDCLTMAGYVARTLCGNTPHAHAFEESMLLQAKLCKYDIVKFVGYLKSLNKSMLEATPKFNIDFSSGLDKYLPPVVTVSTEAQHVVLAQPKQDELLSLLTKL